MIERYRIIKNKPNDSTDYILLYPLIEGDEIYEYDDLQEAEYIVSVISNYDIYKNISLKIVKVFYIEEDMDYDSST
jgi:hypothetical protein